MPMMPTLDEAQVAYLVCDPELKITAMSAHAADLLGVTPDELLGVLITDAVLALAMSAPRLHEVVTGTLSQFAVEKLNLFQPNGETRYLSLYALSFASGLLVILADQSNQMRLQQHIQQQYYELSLLHERVAEQNQELTLRSQRTADLLALVTHDLRSRLSGMSSSIEFLLEPDAEPLSDGQQHTLKLLKQEVDAVLALTRKVLDLQRLEAATPAHRYPIELDLLVEQVAQAFYAHARERDVTILFDHDGALEQTFAPNVIVIGDSEVLQQAIANLISNGIRHTQRGCTIVLRLTTLDNIPVLDPPLDPAKRWCVLDVEDNGPGIAPDIAQRIFEPFSRGGQTGLGLVVAQKAIQQHGGRLLFESYPGTGTTFHVYLPYVPQEQVGA
jgi:signal transduction histidine kinase